MLHRTVLKNPQKKNRQLGEFTFFFKKKEKFHTEHYVSGQDDIFVCYYFILFKDKNTKVVNKIPMCIRN